MIEDVLTLATRAYDAEMDAAFDALARSLGDRDAEADDTQTVLLLTARISQLNERDRALADLRARLGRDGV